MRDVQSMNVYEIQKFLLKARSEEEFDEIINDIEMDQMIDLVKILVNRINTIGAIASVESDCETYNLD